MVVAEPEEGSRVEAGRHAFKRACRRPECFSMVPSHYRTSHTFYSRNLEPKVLQNSSRVLGALHAAKCTPGPCANM